MNERDIDPPDDVPEEVVRIFDASDGRQLRAVIDYAQRLLEAHRSRTDEIEPRDGEELVRVDDHGGYSNVVVERPDETGEARGPFAYRVQWEPDVDGGDGHYQWHYLGRVADDTGAS